MNSPAKKQRPCGLAGIIRVYTEIETMKATAPSAQIRASLQEPSIDEVIRACHRALKKHYGDRLIDVMVYGSAAGGK